jgi:predicted TIM-barrel fold metal-dependent hydrolase
VVALALFDSPSAPLPAIDRLQRDFRAGRWDALAEIAAPQAGVALNDPQLERYWALAESLDAPVGIHVGRSAPASAPGASPKVQSPAANPLVLKQIVAKHPRLRIWLMQSADPFRDETFALMASSPQVFTDVAGLDWANGPESRAAVHAFLKEAVARGLESRVMFGSDAGAWPQAVGEAIRNVDAAPFLTAAQKRAIFYTNAKRFFRFADPN